MSDTDTLLARAECEDLFLDFHGLIDAGRAREAIDLFTEDGSFEVRGRPFEGRDAILGFLTARESRTDRHTRHAAANFRFRRTSATTAQATAMLTIFASEGDGHRSSVPEAVSDCEIEFRRDDDGRWRTTTRRHLRFAPDPRPERSA